MLLLIRGDAYNGTVDRTFVIAASDNASSPNIVYYAFNARVGGLQWDMSVSAEGKYVFTLHPVGGNSYGWSNNT